MKRIVVLTLMMVQTILCFAQQKAFDIVSFNVPKNWTPKQNISNISYTRTDGNSWAQIGIYQHRDSEGNIDADFDKDWRELVSNGKSISAVEKTTPKTENGWLVMSGKGIWQYNGANVTTILTVYSNEKISVAVVCNASALPYLKDYQLLISSIAIKTAPISTTSIKADKAPDLNTNAPANSFSIIGLWTDYSLESSGNFNGRPQYTAGYLRKEYAFNKDGTYVFRNKQWITKTKDILFIQETGTYLVRGNQLIITPKTGKGTFWEKKASSSDWGKYVKAVDYKLEKVSYSLKLIYDPNYSNSIVLTSVKPTQRDGGKFNAPNDPYVFHYSFRKLSSLIDYPPGLK